VVQERGLPHPADGEDDDAAGAIPGRDGCPPRTRMKRDTVAPAGGQGVACVRDLPQE